MTPPPTDPAALVASLHSAATLLSREYYHDHADTVLQAIIAIDAQAQIIAQLQDANRLLTRQILEHPTEEEPMTDPDDYDRDRDEEPEPDEEPEEDGPDAEENEDYPVVTGDEDPPPLIAYDLPRPRPPEDRDETAPFTADDAHTVLSTVVPHLPCLSTLPDDEEDGRGPEARREAGE